MEEEEAAEMRMLASKSSNVRVRKRLEALSDDILNKVELKRLASISRRPQVTQQLMALANDDDESESSDRVGTTNHQLKGFDLNIFTKEASKARTQLLRGVTKLDLDGALPGTICVFGDRAFPLISSTVHTIGAAVLASTAECVTQHGRIIAFSHESVWDGKPRTLKPSGFTQFFLNSMQWAANKSSGSKIRIAVIGQTIEWLQTLLRDVKAEESEFVAVPWDTADNANTIDVVLWCGAIGSGDVIDPDNVGAQWHSLLQAVAAGVGLLLGTCTWGFEQVTGTQVKHQSAQNWLLRKIGLALSERLFEGPKSIVMQEQAITDVLANHAGVAVRKLEKAGFPKDVPPEAVQTITFAIQTLSGVSGLDMLDRWPGLHNLVEIDDKTFPFNSGEKIVANTRAAIQLTFADKKLRDSNNPTAAPGASAIWNRMNTLGKELDQESWPTKTSGVLAPSTQCSLDPTVSGWQSSGLFAQPGCPVAITIAAASDGLLKETKWEVRVGCHIDKLWHKTEWLRYPDCAMAWKLQGDSTITSAFGGPIYFECIQPSRSTSKLQIECANAMRAPLFTPGMSQSEWDRQRCLAAPFAELCGEKIVFSLPSSFVRNHSAAHLDNVMMFWDSIVKSHRELTGATQFSTRLERVTCDIQISYGYMHSGYPVMVHLDQVDGSGAADSPSILDLESLAEKGSWGLFHEFGHNKQLDSYTIGSTVEVTVNLFTLYTMWSKYAIKPLYHPWLDPAKVKAQKHLEAETPTLTKDNGVALLSYAQLVDRFGWDMLKQVMKQFLPDTVCVGDATMVTTHDGGFVLKRHATTPIVRYTEKQKMQNWITRWCNTTQHDLIPFFAKWGWPVDGLETISQNEWPVFDNVHLGLKSMFDDL